MSNQNLGGWTTYSDEISAEAKKIFDTALGSLLGVKYTPLSVASQVVAGTNYSFFCNAQGAYLNAPNNGAIVSIFNPLDGTPHVTQITVVSH
jgi:hypothetical protein